MQTQIDIIKALQSISNSFFDFLFNAFSFLGEQYILVAIIAFIYFVLDKEKGELIAAILFSTTLLNNALKGIFLAPRPFEVDTEIINKRPNSSTGSSFPSGHSQIGASFYSSIYLYFPKKVFLYVIIPIIFLIGLSRIYLGVHFITDVIAGISLGLIVAIILSNLYKKYPNYKFQIHLLILFIFTPFLFFYEDFNLFIKIGEDFYKGFSLLLGFILALYIEKRFVNFTCDINLKTKIFRFIGSLITALIIYVSLKFAFIGLDNIITTFIRYFMLSFITLGIYPFLFLKLNFLKENKKLV